MMGSKIIFLGIAWRAGRGVFEQVGVWELFRVFRGNIWVRRDADPLSGRCSATCHLQVVARGVDSLLLRVSSRRSLIS